MVENPAGTTYPGETTVHRPGEINRRERVARCDMHIHSSASSKPVVPLLGRVGCPESYSEPERVYDLARARAMDLVTLTDHDTIDGALELVERGFPGAFIGEEVTVHFPEDDCKLHVLVWGLTPHQHEQIETLGLRSDVYRFAAWLRQENLAHALAHPLYIQNRRLTRWHVERCAILFKGFETLNGAHSGTHRVTLEHFLDALTPARMLDLIDRHGIEPLWPRAWAKTTTAGSDDHALLNVARTWTEAHPDRLEPAAFLREVMATRCTVHGQPGHSPLLAHQLATVGLNWYARRILPTQRPVARETGRRILRFAGVEAPKPSTISLVADAIARKLPGRRTKRPSPILDALRSGIGPLLAAHPGIADLLTDPTGPDGPPFADHEAMAAFTDDLTDALARTMAPPALDAARSADRDAIINALTSYACLLAAQIPHIFSLFHQNKERRLLREIELDCGLPPTDPDDMKLMLFTDTLGDVNGVSRFIRDVGEQAARTGRDLRIVTSTRFDVPDVPYITNIDPVFARRMPKYENLEIVLPPLLRLLRLADAERPDVIHVSTPGPVGLAGVLAAVMLRIPLCGVYHTDFPAYIDHLFNDGVLTRITASFMRLVYGRFATIFSRSTDYMDALEALGLDRSKMVRLAPGIDLSQFRTDFRGESIWRRYPGVRRDSVKVLSCGRVSVEKNLPLLTRAWPKAQRRIAAAGVDAQLIVVGDGPYRAEMEPLLAHHDAVFLGFKHGRELGEIYASSDFFVFPSVTDTLGQVVLESQSSGLPVLVSDQGGPKEVVDDGITARVLPDDADAWTDAIVELATDHELRERMGRAAATRSQRYSIEQSFEEFWVTHARLLDDNDAAEPAVLPTPEPARN